MKMRITFFLFLSILLGSLSACSNKDDKNDVPSEAIAQAFSQKYPGVEAVDWTQYGDYTKAEFSYKGDEIDAWFYIDGTCLLSISQVAFSSLPQEISSALANGLYSSWTPDNEAKIYEPVLGALFYIIEVSKAGNTDRDLYYTTTGELHKEVTIDYDEDDLPIWMSSFIKQRYTHALVIEAEKLLDERYNANLLYGRNVATIWFTRNQDWEYTSWAVAQNDVPVVVLDVLKGEAYQGYSIRSVEYREDSSQDYYYFDLYKTGSLDLIARITPEGQIILN